MRLLALMVLTFSLAAGYAQAAMVDTVHFPSADGKTILTGYVFAPTGPGPHPAVVMLHGRAGPYSSSKRGQHNQSMEPSRETSAAERLSPITA